MRAIPEALANYPGNKGIRQLYKPIISQIPPHQIYVEGFVGSGKVYQHIKPAKISLLNDLDSRVIKLWTELDHPSTYSLNMTAVDLLTKRIPETYAKWYKPEEIFIYLDPPYPISARCSKQEIYKHEMTDGAHYALLAVLKEISFSCMISTNPNQIYEHMLKDWRKIEFQVSYRGTVATEVIYMNYPHPTKLHDDRYYGDNCWERQRIKRKTARLIKRLNELDPLERSFILNRITN